MWLRLAVQPWWVQWLLPSVLFAVPLAVTMMAADFDRAARWNEPVAWGAALIGGIVCAGLLVALQSRERSVLQGLCAEVGPARYAEAVKAAASGPLPVDPATRAAAARLARFRLEMARRTPRWVAPLAGGLIVASQVVGLLGEPSSITVRGLCFLVVGVGIGVYGWLYPRLVESRAAVFGQHVRQP